MAGGDDEVLDAMRLQEAYPSSRAGGRADGVRQPIDVSRMRMSNDVARSVAFHG